jgi:hypothetical protein
MNFSGVQDRLLLSPRATKRNFAQITPHFFSPPSSSLSNQTAKLELFEPLQSLPVGSDFHTPSPPQSSLLRLPFDYAQSGQALWTGLKGRK